jgi:hypothetical protein
VFFERVIKLQKRSNGNKDVLVQKSKVDSGQVLRALASSSDAGVVARKADAPLALVLEAAHQESAILL